MNLLAEPQGWCDEAADEHVAFVESRLPDENERLAFWRFSRQYYRSLAHPSQLVPKIQATDFRLLESTEKLGEFITEFSPLVSAGQCRIPLGGFRGMSIDFVPRFWMVEMVESWEKWREMSNLDGYGNLAPSTYFSIAKCCLKDRSGRMNPGVSVHAFVTPPAEGYCLS